MSIPIYLHAAIQVISSQQAAHNEATEALMNKIRLLEEKSLQKPAAEDALLQRISELESKLKESQDKGNGAHPVTRKGSKPTPPEMEASDKEDHSDGSSEDEDGDEAECITTPDGRKASLLHANISLVRFKMVVYI